MKTLDRKSTGAESKLPEHFMVSSTDGGLYDTRKPNWSNQPSRSQYAWTHRCISTLAEVKATLRAGRFAWPGGYPLFLITKDGAALCFECARKEFRQIVWDFTNYASTGWRVCGCEINYEDADLFCDNCSKQIVSAYK